MSWICMHFSLSLLYINNNALYNTAKKKLLYYKIDAMQSATTYHMYIAMQESVENFLAHNTDTYIYYTYQRYIHGICMNGYQGMTLYPSGISVK